MVTSLPQRPEPHVLAERSEQYFRQCLPTDWICDKPASDYGIDLRVGLVADARVTSKALVVQLKATGAVPAGDHVATRLSVPTYNYLWNLLEVALLVRYVANENEAYWLLLKDVPLPDQARKTFTVHIPRANRLSRQPWTQIADYVSDIHQRKLDAIRHQERIHNRDA